MFEDHNETITELLKSNELVDEEQMEAILEEATNTGKSIAAIAIDNEILTREDLLEQLAEMIGSVYVADVPASLGDEEKAMIRPSLARMYGVVPIRADGNEITMFAVDPLNFSIVDDLTFALGKDISLAVADPESVASLVAATYGTEDTSVDDLLSELEADGAGDELGDDLSEQELADVANQTPIIRFVNLILQQAIHDKASDIHFEPFEKEFRIRYRIDGALYEMSPPPRKLAVPVISRLKVIANLNIAEKRIPQDGRIKMTISGRPVDLRVSTLPTQFGESVVLRVLDKTVVNLDLNALSMPEDIIKGVREVVKRPNGIFIVTGPTGSGKTTTLYSALREINSIESKILTAEDPVEYEIEGIMQVAVNHQVGLDFARALRAFLRQDPDKIMVGEIRDLETAQIAVQASLTGHVVLSTLHTNDAAGAVTRLIDMGLEPFLISASLEAVLAQRLVRRICSACKKEFEPTSEMIEQLGADPLEVADKSFYFGAGCALCNRTGYAGRVGLFEMITVTDAFRTLINQKAPGLVLRQKAIEKGMRSLREDGLRSIFDGRTTIEEVLKYT
ncbi:MAG: GspE/PulE family protein [Puniceicoccaceae bacterium]